VEIVAYIMGCMVRLSGFCHEQRRWSVWKQNPWCLMNGVVISRVGTKSVSLIICSGWTTWYVCPLLTAFCAASTGLLLGDARTGLLGLMEMSAGLLGCRFTLCVVDNGWMHVKFNTL